VAGDRDPDVGSAGRRLDGCASLRGGTLAESRHLKRDCPQCDLVSGLQRLLPADSLAIDERAVGASEVPNRQLPIRIDNLTMATADLRRLDPDQAVVMAANAGHTLTQLERGGSASA